MMRPRTKIVATLGPASSGRAILGELISAGLSVGRLNCSHGTWDERLELIHHVREESAR
ncbi:MAG: pyruvate kinase, partial [Armatimonadota bacterium]